MGIKSTIKFFVFIFAIVFVGFFCYKTGVYIGEQNILTTPPLYINQTNPFGEREVDGVDFSVFWEVWRRLESKFLEKENINYQEMVYGAIRGMIASLNDPYTSFFDPDETKSFQEELSGKYEGVGMYVGIKDEQLTIISPLKGAPAESAGLKAGDKIVKIDDIYTLDLAIDEAVSLIKGKTGTKVKLTIQRKGWDEPREFEVRREVIKIPTLEWEMVEDDIALIKIYQFNQLLTGEFSRAAVGILRSGANKLIIDLRNNPGGYLEVAQVITSWFVEQGKPVVWEKLADQEEMLSYDSKGSAAFKDYPLVVLINQGSASASEILAGALRDHNGAMLVGETSFGKGSVQEQMDLSDGSSMKVTIAKWFTPNGNSIDEAGLEPDAEVIMELSEEELELGNSAPDVQLEKAIEIIKSLR